MQKILIPTPADWLLSEASERILQIKQAAGVKPEVWNAFYLPMLISFASNVQRLPLTRDVFGGDRGALDFGLSTALTSLRLASAQVFFPAAVSEDRRVLEPQCQFAAFAATLCSVVAMVAENTFVRAQGSGAEYHVLVSPSTLHQWLLNESECVLQWRVNEPPLAGTQCAAIAVRVIPLGLLANFDLRVSLMIFGAIAPRESENGIESTLSKVVRNTISRVLAHQVNNDRKRFDGTPNIDRATEIDIDGIVNGTAVRPAPSVQNESQEAVPNSAVLPTGSPAPPDVLVGEAKERAERRLRTGEKALQEWFALMQSHPKFPEFQSKLSRTERGVEVPISTLGMFGIGAPVVRALLGKAELIVDRTQDSRGIILHPDLTPFFFTQETT